MGVPIRINNVKGYSNRSNNIIYCPPLVRTTNKDDCTAVVYFGGDVQDVPEKMETNRDNKNYIKWNLENTAILLREAFPKAHVIVVRPVRMEYSTFSCFDNFVRGNNAGIPDHTPMHYALQHLEEVLINLTKKLLKPGSELLTAPQPIIPTTTTPAAALSDNAQDQDMDIDILQIATPTLPIQPQPSTTEANQDALWWRENLNLDKVNLKLIGFSKGCVVLNQFLYEFHYLKTLTPDDSTMMRLVSRIKDMFWLDGGHGGGKNTWITSRSLLETLCRLGINIHVHVTPYQIQDDHRPWIRKEEKAFTDLLKRLGATLSRHLYPCDINSTNLFTHFEVLNHFRQHQIQILAQAHLQQQIQQQTSSQPQENSASTSATSSPTPETPTSSSSSTKVRLDEADEENNEETPVVAI